MNNLTEKTQEWGAQIVITPALINADADGKRVAYVQRALTGSIADALVVNGQKAVKAFTDIEPDLFLRNVEINQTTDAIPELTLLALVAKQQHYQEQLVSAMMRLESLSWWRFLWLKLRGRHLVEVR